MINGLRVIVGSSLAVGSAVSLGVGGSVGSTVGVVGAVGEFCPNRAIAVVSVAVGAAVFVGSGVRLGTVVFVGRTTVALADEADVGDACTALTWVAAVVAGMLVEATTVGVTAAATACPLSVV
jgi:hypothetical protein